MAHRTHHRLTQWSLSTFHRSVHATRQWQTQKERQYVISQLDFIASGEHKQAPALTEMATNPTLNKLHTDTHHSMFQQKWRRCRQKIHAGKHWQNPTLHQSSQTVWRALENWGKKEQFLKETKKATVPGCGAICYSSRLMLWNVAIPRASVLSYAAWYRLVSGNS